jgi:hypothetical protein
LFASPQLAPNHVRPSLLLKLWKLRGQAFALLICELSDPIVSYPIRDLHPRIAFLDLDSPTRQTHVHRRCVLFCLAGGQTNIGGLTSANAFSVQLAIQNPVFESPPPPSGQSLRAAGLRRVQEGPPPNYAWPRYIANKCN